MSFSVVMKSRLRWAALGLMGLGSTAPADEVGLVNGDRLTGTVLGKSGDVLRLKTPYADPLRIPWNQVESIASDGGLRVLLKDGVAIIGRLVKDDERTMRIDFGDGEAGPILLSHVATIVPADGGLPRLRLSGRANVGLSLRDGNSDGRNIHVDGEIVVRAPPHRFTAGAIHNRAEADGVETEDNVSAHLKYDRHFTRRWYAFANASFSEDRFKDLDLKTAAGVGAGFQVFESAGRNLSLEAGPNYVHEDYISAADNEYSAARWALRFDQTLAGRSAQVFHRHEVLAGLEDEEDIAATAETGLRLLLTTGLNATFQVNWVWDNTPAAGTERADTTYLFTLGYAW